ncbi:MAG: Hydantoinase B/oxoprolinase, partial [Acetobacteraceae bacterium]|nr:Hydantoinase B/oxoprolinase [Acetobacteraceae bacterium]
MVLMELTLTDRVPEGSDAVMTQTPTPLGLLPISQCRRMRHHRGMTDPITIAVLQNRLNAIAEEMGEAMLRTA